jgi:hypothetical protein
METILVSNLVLSIVIFLTYSIGAVFVVRRQRFYPLQKRPVSLVIVELLCGIFFGIIEIPLEFSLLPCNFRELWHITIICVLSLTLMAGSYQAFVKFKFNSDSIKYLSNEKNKESFEKLTENSWALRHMKRFTNIFLLKVVVFYTLLFVFVVSLLSYKIDPELWENWKQL